MTVIGIIGAGHIGSTLARLAAAAGHEVVISNSRGPETLTDLVADLGPNVRAATAADAASAGDVVVVTIPLKNYRQVPVGPLVGKVVIDTDNYYPQRDGHIAELDSEATTTSELLQRHLRESRVVKAFNNIGAAHLGALARPSGSGTERRCRSPVTTQTPSRPRDSCSTVSATTPTTSAASPRAGDSSGTSPPMSRRTASVAGRPGR